MSENHWKQIETLFHGALEQPLGQRDAWLDRQEADETVLSQVKAMLAADENTRDPAEAMVAQSIDRLTDAQTSVRGKQLGAWRIISELGSGGMGSVFLAERADEEYSRRVALKLIRGFPDPASLERLRTERQILADLNHPNIAAMIDGGTTEDGQPYLVMEYVEGLTVDQWCEQASPSIEQRVRLFRDICAATQYAHRNLVIHRDLKPNNVLVTADARPVLLDFGIAKLVEPGSDGSDATRVGRYYTPGFSSPEQMSGAPVSTSSDIYSLGRLFELMLHDSNGASPAPPRELQAIIRRATAEEPGDRYSSVEALDADLASYLGGRPVSAASHRVAYRAWKFVKRHRFGVTAAATASLLVFALIVQVALESQRSRAAEAQARVEAANANQVLGFLIELIEAAAPAQARGEDVTVMQMLEAGRERISEQAIADPALRMRTLFALGSVYRALENRQYAQELLSESAALARALGDPEEEVRALNVLGMSALLENDRATAEEALNRSVSLVRAHPEIEAGERASAINDLGLLKIEYDELEAGRELIAEALRVREEAGLAEHRIATSYHNLAEAEDNLGNYREAMSLYQTALEMKERSIGRVHPSYANSLNGLQLVAGRLGKNDIRREALQQQLEIRRQLYGEDAPILYRDYNELAFLHHDMGRFELAIENYRRGMELEASKVGGPTQTWLFTNNMAAAYKDMGMPEQAEALYRRSLALRTERFGEDSATTARAQHNLARILLQLGQPEVARQLATSALTVRIATQGEQHQETIGSHLLLELIDAREAITPERQQRLLELIEELTEALSENSYGVLNARAAVARALLDAGQVEPARQMMQTTIERYREQLVAGHPMAAALELDLARLDLMEGRPDQAQQRLERLSPTIIESFPEVSRFRRQLGCLQAGTTEASCWR